jgi:8-oxo-dGTP pyrophosphatase MutT (NUDIX family)
MSASPSIGPPNIAVGFVVYPPERLVLLHLRGPENNPDPNVWAAIGGHEEPEDGGDLRVTLSREMREEFGITAELSRFQELARMSIGPDRQAAIFALVALSTSMQITLREGRGLAWFTVPEALALPNLASITRSDLPRITAWLDTVYI